MPTVEEQSPVTTMITLTIKENVTEKFEQWLRAISGAAEKFEGHLGVYVLRPGAGSRQYTTIFRFRTPAQLRAWMDADVRANYLREAGRYFEGEVNVQRLTGLEPWFTLPERPAMRPMPPRFKMAIVTFMAVFSLLLVIPRLAAPFLEPLPHLARTAIVCAIMIALMTYGLMPILIRLLRRWLFM